ncbi:hypothetical protein NCCP436_27750 [Pseudomonas sp. NCCP-436]|nr:hypothetical protein NCCP436_27750 [Pseudomonas sp. NCCP-436]
MVGFSSVGKASVGKYGSVAPVTGGRLSQNTVAGVSQLPGSILGGYVFKPLNDAVGILADQKGHAVFVVIAQ